MNNSTTLISVVICTFNRFQLLENAIQSVCLQASPKDSYEILVVDNNSTDQTRSVVEKFSHEFPNVRYICEPIQGLSQARNCGWQNAKGDYVVYLDDDGWASEHWLPTAFDIIKNVGPAVFGGPYFASYNSPKPDWFRDSYESFTSGSHALILETGYLSGGNIAFKRSILKCLGGFDSNLGMRGKARGYTEETSLIRRLRTIKPSALIYYDPRFYIQHLVAPKKMKMLNLVQIKFIRGRYHYLGAMDEEYFGKYATVRLALKVLAKIALFVAICVSSNRRDKKLYPFARNYIYEVGLRRVAQAGTAYEQFKASLRR
jgi:glycosyltransferase involved in cell wall biosynthesis